MLPYIEYSSRKRVKREPLMTLADLAREKGMKVGTVKNRYITEGRPLTIQFSRKHRNYYNAKELRDWFASLNWRPQDNG